MIIAFLQKPSQPPRLTAFPFVAQ
jgi:hypothetical protein